MKLRRFLLRYYPPGALRVDDPAGLTLGSGVWVRLGPPGPRPAATGGAPGGGGGGGGGALGGIRGRQLGELTPHTSLLRCRDHP